MKHGVMRILNALNLIVNNFEMMSLNLKKIFLITPSSTHGLLLYQDSGIIPGGA